MHYLHKILVYVPDVVEDTATDMDKKELLEFIRSHAESETEGYYEDVFDWRETDYAGRWSGEYPQQIYLASDDIDWFIKELEEVQSSQRAEIDSCMAQLKGSVGFNFEQIVNGLWNRDTMYDQKDGFNVMIPYYLYNISCHLYGRYRSDSYFYNTYDYTARLFNSDIEKVRQEPQNWALVMFDYHN